MSNLSELQSKIVGFRDARDWKQFHNPKDVAMSLVLEAAELMEHFQWKDEAEVLDHLKNHKDEVADELADVFYWVLLMAHDLDINISFALNSKLIKNDAKYPVNKSKGKNTKYTDL